MRRALLVAAAAAPMLAAGQTPTTGQILFIQGSNDTVHGQWISLAECNAASTTNVELSWAVELINSATGIPSGAKYQAFASNQAHPDTGCNTANNDNSGLVAASVGSIVTSNTTNTYTVSQFLAVNPTAWNCNVTGDTPIHVCMQGTDPTTNKVFGIARGTLTLAVTPPGSPSNASAGSGDSSLRVTWRAPNSTPLAYDYRVVAKSVEAGCADPANPASTCAFDTRDTTTHQATGIRTESQRMTGLVNEVLYRVEVYASSEAGNENSTPATATGTPMPSADFWEVYQSSGGREEGGCATGSAGALALLATASLLALARRKR